MLTAFERAWTTRRSPGWQSLCTFAGRTARLRVAGDGLAQKIADAFRHLLERENPSGADLTIDLWDASDTSVPCPVSQEPVEPRQLSSNSYVEFGLILGSLADRFVGAQRPQVVAWLDRCERHLVGCVARHDQLSLYDRGKPLHFPLLLWHHDQGAEVIHAALISKNGEGVLLAGKGGAGKSTAALACLEAGFHYLGDDYIGLEACDHGTFVGHSLYSVTWFMADHLTRFPRLIPHAIYPERPEQEKTLVPLSQIFPGRLVSSARIHALVLPRVTGNSSARIRPASKGDALFALAPSSILLRPSSGARTLDKLARLAEQVPCYWLELGRNLNEVPDRVQELIELARLGREC
jgi:HPr Serine kinase C-terminal domain